MITIFGATTDLGTRLTGELRAAGHEVRCVSRSEGLEAVADLETGANVAAAMQGSDVVVSCAHARYTATILTNLPLASTTIVLMGSAWRYSRVPNARADQVRSAEKLFLSKKFNGVMLHPTMIYGGRQENNIRRLLGVIRSLPVIPAPGGGYQLVRPIYVDDVVRALFIATQTHWSNKHVIGLSGPPLTWRKMAELCAASIERRRPIVNVPTAPLIALLSLLDRFGINPLDPNIIRRFKEDVNVSSAEMIELLAIQPRDFESGINLAVRNWRQEGLI